MRKLLKAMVPFAVWLTLSWLPFLGWLAFLGGKMYAVGRGGVYRIQWSEYEIAEGLWVLGLLSMGLLFWYLVLKLIVVIAKARGENIDPNFNIPGPM